MSIQIDGDLIAAEEVLAQVKIWDKVIIGHEVSALVQQCANDVSMFDVSTQQNGVEEYKSAWEKFSPYFVEGTQITRRDIKIYASEELAVMHCHSKVEHEALKGKLQIALVSHHIVYAKKRQSVVCCPSTYFNTGRSDYRKSHCA